MAALTTVTTRSMRIIDVPTSTGRDWRNPQARAPVRRYSSTDSRLQMRDSHLLQLKEVATFPRPPHVRCVGRRNIAPPPSLTTVA